MPQNPAIEMRRIVKRFAGVVANNHVDFTLEVGEIHALLGENGAGKSTLMQVLYGFHRMDAGEILVNGKQTSIKSPADSIALGMGMVHQEFMLVHPFSVVENVVLGLKETSGPMLDLERASQKLRRLSEQHHLAIDPESRIDSLSIGVQQRVEILKLLYRDAKVLILDEPTAVLTAQEKDSLFALLRLLRAEGRSIVIVTHKLHEIMELADRVTVMRDGRVVAERQTGETNGDELARLMVGRDVSVHVTRTERQPGPCVLSISDLHVQGETGDKAGPEKVRGISLDVHSGEIVGIAGVEGNGQSQLAQAIMNLLPVARGRVKMRDQDLTYRSVAEHRAQGLSYVAADRRGVASVTALSLADNAVLGSQRSWLRGPFFDRTKIRVHAQTLLTRFGVRGAGIDSAAGKLSGGNLQKLILGREIMRSAETTSTQIKTSAIVIEQPTRGLDAGAVEAVWNELLREREQGTAILLISAELEELMNLCDRIAVIFAGQIVGIVDAKTVTMEELGVMIAGTAIAPSAARFVASYGEQPGGLHG